MTSSDVRKKYLEFFTARGHAEIPSAPLVPENDSTTLFTSSGMQPLIPYLLGQPHPSGKRLVDSQKSFRSQDIEEVGDNRHTTFFEMLGNWSLGDYFKKKQLPWIFEFLTAELNLDPKRLYVTVFTGSNLVERDTESVIIWKHLFESKSIDAKDVENAAIKGMQGGRIFYYDETKNWWSRSGVPQNMPPGEPGGPDSEVFFDFGEHLKLHEKSPFRNQPCHPNCDCGRFLEIANSVFMEYVCTGKSSNGKTTTQTFSKLDPPNVDFGGGLERMVAAVNDDPDIFRTDLFTEIITTVEEFSNAKYTEESKKPAIRVIADHLKAATFLMAGGVIPSNKTQGYVLRRLLRRSAVKMHQLRGGLTPIPGFQAICTSVMRTYRDTQYFDRSKDEIVVNKIIEDEMDKFSKSLDRGLKEFEKAADSQLNDLFAFNLFQTYGFPYEITEELFKQKSKTIDRNKFDEIYKAHQALSRTAAAGMFKGGLADKSEQTIKLHTAHHLLLAALQKIVDANIKQRGSNITAERLRMDFSFSRKVTPEELQKVEELVNQKIKENLPVARKEMRREEAEKIGAQMEFGHKYPDMVSVYFVGSPKDFFSAEFCGGPHVEHTGIIGHFKIKKEESAAAGIRRIYASVE